MVLAPHAFGKGLFLYVLVSFLSIFLAPVTTPASVSIPGGTQYLLDQYCTSCHDADHYLDLSSKGPGLDAEQLKEAIEEVRSQRMPPPGEGGEVQSRFAMDPQHRGQLIAALQRLVSEDNRPILPAISDYSHWSAIARQLATGTPPPPHSARPNGSRVVPWEFFWREEKSIRSCTQAAERLDIPSVLGRDPDDGKLMKATAILVRTLFGRTLPDRVTRPISASLRRLRGSSSSWGEAWIKTCVVNLSGPSVMYPFEVGSLFNVQ